MAEKCKKYKPAKLAKCQKTCGLCDCEALVDNRKCKIKKEKCNQNAPKIAKKCKKKCKKDRKKKKPMCQKTCCELGLAFF